MKRTAGPKIFLVQAQISSSDSGLRDERWYLPLGLLSIASYLKTHGFDDVTVLDSAHDSPNEIFRRIAAETPDIVGVNFNAFSIALFDKVVDCAKGIGALTVAGGQAATPIPHRLLSANDCLDAVVAYDGEQPMVEIARRVEDEIANLSGIPQVFHRSVIVGESKPFRVRRSTRIASNELVLPNVAKYPAIGPSGINGFDFRRYYGSWNRPDIDPVRVPTSTYVQKGCGRACTFCARIDKALRQRAVEQVYDELAAYARAGVNYVHIVDDVFTADLELVRRLRTQIQESGELGIRFWCFADIRDLSSECICELTALGVEKVLVGIESGNENLRRRSGKRFSNETLFRCLGQLGQAGIKVEDSYVLGLAGESEQTLMETFQLAKVVESLCHTEGTAFNLMTPLMGSPDWNRLMKIPGLRQKYAGGYNFDIAGVREDFFRHFCSFGDINLSSISLS